MKHLCETKCGEGICQQSLPDDEKAEISAAEDKLRKWVNLWRPSTTRFDEAWKQLGLLYLGPRHADALSAAAPAPGVVFVLLYGEASPLACVVCWRASFLPGVGDVISFDLSMATLATEIWVTRTF